MDAKKGIRMHWKNNLLKIEEKFITSTCMLRIDFTISLKHIYPPFNLLKI